MSVSSTQLHTAPSEGIVFTDAEARALEALRRRYREDHDLFSPHELARLRFVRWLVRT